MPKKLLGLILATALGVLGTSCGSSAPEETSSDDYRYEKFLKVNISEPKFPLLPAAANEDNTGKLVDLLYSGLMSYDAEGKLRYEEAEDITLEGDRTYRVRLRPNLEFSDGTLVTAQDYVDSWNYAVSEELELEYFMEPIAGYEPGVSEMSGLHVIDERTFTVELSYPQSDFLDRLGYSAFAVMPPQAMKKSGEFIKHPFGSGPYTMAEWYHNESILLVPNAQYSGPRTVQNKGLRFQHYENLAAAYTDLQRGELDILDTIPSAQYSSFEMDLQGRTINQPVAVFQSLSIAMDATNFSGEAGRLRRQAISLAIDRHEIVDSVFGGSSTPARDFTSPVVSGYNAEVPGNEILNFDPVRAQELWQQAEAMDPFEGDFTIAYNADRGNEDWVLVVAQELQDTLGINAYGVPYPTLADLRSAIADGEITAGFRTGWIADYPSAANFLIPVFGSEGSANDVGYDNPEFDDVLRRAAESQDEQQTFELYEQAQEMLFADLPAIPLWYSNTLLGYSPKVDNVVVRWNGAVNYSTLVERF